MNDLTAVLTAPMFVQPREVEHTLVLQCEILTLLPPAAALTMNFSSRNFFGLSG